MAKLSLNGKADVIEMSGSSKMGALMTVPVAVVASSSVVGVGAASSCCCVEQGVSCYFKTSVRWDGCCRETGGGYYLLLVRCDDRPYGVSDVDGTSFRGVPLFVPPAAVGTVSLKSVDMGCPRRTQFRTREPRECGAGGSLRSTLQRLCPRFVGRDPSWTWG